MTVFDIHEDASYEQRCERGHRVITVLQNPKFELLFDSAALALREGFSREAVASFAAALEDFFLLYVRVVCSARGVQAEALEETRKALKQSERRLGALYAVYAIEHGAAFKGDPRARREFRNDVVHNGRWPTSDEALDYARYAYETIVPLLSELRDKHGKHLDEELRRPLTLAHAAAVASQAREGALAARPTLFVRTLISHVSNDLGRPFDEAFDVWKGLNWWDIARDAVRADADESTLE